MKSDTTEVTVNGVVLEVDFTYTPAERQTLEHPGCCEDVDIEEIRHHGEEIMCFFDDASIARVRTAILEKRGE